MGTYFGLGCCCCCCWVAAEAPGLAGCCFESFACVHEPDDAANELLQLVLPVFTIAGAARWLRVPAGSEFLA